VKGDKVQRKREKKKGKKGKKGKKEKKKKEPNRKIGIPSISAFDISTSQGLP
jgi:hypothetical protein